MGVEMSYYFTANVPRNGGESQVDIWISEDLRCECALLRECVDVTNTSNVQDYLTENWGEITANAEEYFADCRVDDIIAMRLGK